MYRYDDCIGLLAYEYEHLLDIGCVVLYHLIRAGRTHCQVSRYSDTKKGQVGKKARRQEDA